MKQKNYKNEVMTFAECTEHNAVATDQNPLRHAELYKTNRRSVSEPCELVSEGEAVGDSASIHLIKNHDEAMNKTLSIGQSINNIQSLKIDSDFLCASRETALRVEGSTPPPLQPLLGLQNDVKAAAFTLAEVLITLGIIGIIAAMTIPTLISKVRIKELQSRFKMTFSELNQISLSFYNDYGLSVPDYINGSSTKMKTFRNTIFLEYLKGVSTIDDWTHTDKDDSGSNLNTMPYKLYDLTGKSTYNICDNSGYKSDIGGRIYSFNDTPKSGYNGPVICVDINEEKGPNTYGKDFFLFIFTRDGNVIPFGQEHKYNYYGTGISWHSAALVGSQYCDSGGSYTYNSTCAYYALTDTNPEGSGTYWKDFLNGN